ncbi:MAG TPA: autoinducer 2 ABC transporter substrate-binding protein [Candidatus Blautia excrementipullorum]|nr:autoinducer 2 ABC transporter substrate-binding protein [Candidatus Blautia excrementipullorum]
MNKKRLISVIMAATLCAGALPTAVMASEDPYQIVVMPKLTSIPYFQQTGEGAEEAGEDLGVEVIYNGPTTADAAQQVTMIEDYISQGVDAICVAPNDPAAMQSVLQRARDAGIIVLDWDTQADPSLVDASIHNIDDQSFGEHMMQLLVECMGTEEGEYAIVTGGLSAENLNTWIEYATAYAEENYPNLTLVADPYPTDEKQDVAYSTTQDLLRAYPDVKGILGFSTPTGPGCGLAIRDLGLQDEVSLVANAVEDDVQDVLSDGALDVGCLWSCHDLGYLTVCVAKALLDGNTLEDGMEVEGWGPIEVQDEKAVILGPPEDYISPESGVEGAEASEDTADTEEASDTETADTEETAETEEAAE